MWAYGCHYACKSKIDQANVAFACSIVRLTPQSVTTAIDVGIFKDIILIQYGKFSRVVLQGSWTMDHAN
jgi:hypothetical protein